MVTVNRIIDSLVGKSNNVAFTVLQDFLLFVEANNVNEEDKLIGIIAGFSFFLSSLFGAWVWNKLDKKIKTSELPLIVNWLNNFPAGRPLRRPFLCQRKSRGLFVLCFILRNQ